MVSSKTYSIDEYIKSSLINKTILLFLISIIPLALALIYTYKSESDSNAQQAKLAFEANQSVIMNKIDSSIKQIAHANGFRLFLQSSENSRQRDKYKLLTNIEILLLHNPLIEGIEMFNNDDKQVLRNGRTSELSITYDLVYTNDFIDQYGEKFGYLKVYLDKDTLLSQLDNNYYEVVQNTGSKDFLVNFSKLNTNLIHINRNLSVEINPKHEISIQWLYFLTTLIILLITYIVVAKRTINKIIEPIKNIENSIFGKRNSTSSYSNNIKELVWIDKIISNIKVSKLHMKDKLIQLYKKNNEFTVNSLHYLKSSLTSSKLIIDEEFKDHPSYTDLNINLVKTISKVANTINIFKSANDKFDHHEVALTPADKIKGLINDELELYPNISYELVHSDIRPNTFIPISKKHISYIASNLATNAIESGATKILITLCQNDKYLIITFENNGEPIDLNQTECFISGTTSKINGTGTGLSSINKLLINNKSKMYFSIPSNSYNTKLTLKISFINNALDNVLNYVRSKIILSEIVLFNQPDISLSKEIENSLLITQINNEKNLLDYIHLSTKSEIIENQLYIHDYTLYMPISESHFLRLILDGSNKFKQLI